jgi:hypothetical protein
MKHAKRMAFLVLAALLAMSVFFACSDNGTDGGDTTDNVTDAATTVAGTEAPEGSATVYELSSKTTSATIELRDGQPYIVSLKTESGVEKAGEPIPFELPSLGKGSLWTHTVTEPYDDGDGGVGYIFRFKNDEKQVTYDLYAVARPEMAGPFEFFGYVTNHGAETYDTFMPGYYFSMNVDGEDSPIAWTFNKESGIAEGYTWIHEDLERYYEGTGIYQTVLKKGKNATAYNETISWWNQNGQIPLMYIDYGTNGLYIGMEWTNGKLWAKGLGDGTVSLMANLGSAPLNFRTKIEGGATMLMPPVYLGVYDGDVDDGSNIFKHWFFRYKSPDNLRENENEPFVQMDTRTGYEVADLGIESMKWDIAWWNDTGLWGDLRSLEVRNPHYLNMMQIEGCNTLAEYTAKGKEKGIATTLYVLLRDLVTEEPGQPSSVGPNAHPEWFGCISGQEERTAADLGNVDCVAFFQKYLGDFFQNNGVTTWRSDFQPILASSYNAYENRHYGAGGIGNGSDMTYWCTVGFGELVDYLTENVDGFRLESCSEGGSMKDLFTATKASVINCDDSGDFMSWHTTFYDSSYCIPPAQLMLPCVTSRGDPNQPAFYRGVGDYKYALRCALTGAVHLDMYGETEEQYKTYWPYYVDNLYKNVMRPLIKYGNLYHILPRPDGVHWDGLQYIDLNSENETIGMVLLWKPTDTEGPQKTVKLRGLEAEVSYQLTFEDRTEQNAVYTGAELMENGLTVTIAEATGSEMIWISRAN